MRKLIAIIALAAGLAVCGGCDQWDQPTTSFPSAPPVPTCAHWDALAGTSHC